MNPSLSSAIVAERKCIVDGVIRSLDGVTNVEVELV